MGKIKVHPALICNLNESVVNISKKLLKDKSRRVFVVDKDKKLLGIVTTTDLVYKCLAKGKIDLTAKDVMTKSVKSIEKSEPIEKALDIMNSVGTYFCPITDKKKLIGIIHHHDIVAYLIDSKK